MNFVRKISKNLSLIIAICVLVTVGGVYATWNYSQETTNEITDYLTANMQDYMGSSASGHIEVLEKTIDIRVVDNKDAEGDTVGEGVAGDNVAEVEITGHLVILFTAFDGATTTVKNNGISLQYRLGQTGSMVYGTNDAPIFNVNSNWASCDPMIKIDSEGDRAALKGLVGADKQELVDAIDYNNAEVNKFYVVIEGADLQNLISLNGTISLPTLVDYHNFQAALGKGNFQIEVNEKVS